MNFNKVFKKMNVSHAVMLIGAIALVYALYNYSSTKGLIQDSMDNVGHSGSNTYAPKEAHRQSEPIDVAGNPQPSKPIGENSDYANVDGVTSTHNMPKGCGSEPAVDPAELLPKDQNSEWAKLNPMGGGDLENVNLLKSGYHIGINTVSSSLRNANLQLRSEPPNPQMPVGPWNNTTITPDINRRPLEIGSGTC